MNYTGPDEGDEVRRELAGRYHWNRRRFLGLLAAGSGAAALGACSSGGSDAGPASSTAPGGGPARTTTTGPAKVPADPGLAGDPFQLGVASGDPLPTSVILWTRLASKPAERTTSFGVGTDADVAVLWEVAADEQFTKIVASGIEPALAEFGHSVHVDATGLEPDTWYQYRFRIGEHTSAVGRTRTTPKAGASVERLRFAFVSCQARQVGQWTAYDHLAEDDLDLVFHLGDYIYEYPGGEGPLATGLTAEPQTVADYRVLYGAYKSDPKLQKAHLRCPWVLTWDDHEVENNYAGAIPEEKDPDKGAFPARRKAAYQAYYEHQPVRFAPPAADGSLVVNRSFTYGSLATFFVLDGRQHRTDQVCGDQIPTVASSCPAIDEPTHTMLGADQEAWLAKGFGQVDTTWTVLAQQTVMKALVLGDVVLNVDQWDGYPAARRRLLAAVDDAGLENVMVLTGDIHAGGAADLRLTKDSSGGNEGKIVAHELVGTSISSPGFGSLVRNLDLSPLGLAYYNFDDHGYSRSTVTPTSWINEFVVVSTIAEATAEAKVDATVRVDAGTPGLRVVE